MNKTRMKNHPGFKIETRIAVYSQKLKPADLQQKPCRCDDPFAVHM